MSAAVDMETAVDEAQLAAEGAGEEAVPEQETAPEEEAAPEEAAQEEAAQEEAAQEEAVPEESQPEAVVKGRKRGRAARDDASGLEKIAKTRPRWGDKSFEDITIGDVETIVRRCNSLEKELEANANRFEKKIETNSEAVVPGIKAAIAKQLSAQMLYVFAWNDELKETGREISAFVANVTPEMLKALGGDTATAVRKQTKAYFDSIPSKCVPPATRKNEKPHGNGLVLNPIITLQWMKTTQELRVHTSYRFGVCERKRGGTRPKKEKANQDGATQDAADAEEDEEENWQAAGESEVTASCQGGA